jgi:neutral trehalase
MGKSGLSDEKKKLAAQAREVLDRNDRGQYTAPAAIYPHQWLWDSCFVAIGQRHYDVERAKLEILHLLTGQWSNGMVPHMIFARGHEYHREHEVWRSWVSPFAPDDVLTSGITQPPVLAEAIVRVGQKMSAVERRSWYRQTWDGLLRYHQWLYTERDPHNEGLVLQVHPWETGVDNSLPWMAELHEHLLPFWIRSIKKTKLDNVLTWFRRDTRFVPLDQRFETIDALAMFDAQRRLRRKEYNINRVLTHSLFAIEDVGFNSILLRGNQHLREIAKSIRVEIPEDLDKSMQKAIKTFGQLWDPYTEMYYCRDFITHRLLKEPSILSLLPLYSGAISKERAAQLVKLIENENLFGPAYPIPSASVSNPHFSPMRYWQGPSWVNTNWMIIDGLERYGYHDHAAALRESTVEMVEKHGFYEYFNPLTGEPLGIENFSWTAALTIDMLHN